MFAKILFFFRGLDLYLLGSSVLLGLVGLLMIYSTSFSSLSYTSLFARQMIFFAAGLVLLLIFSGIDYRYFNKIAAAAYLVSLVLLAGVLIFGLKVKGSVRWFDLGFFQLQPVEFVKLALIFFLSAFFQKRVFEVSRFRTIALSGLFVAIPVVLTLLQPDLGSAMVLLAIWIGILITAGLKKSRFAWLLAGFIIILAFSWVTLLRDYQKDRLYSFFDPAVDPQGRGYNALQAVTAIGSGGVAGRGLARGVVSQLRFLPERQTDFIFASLAEELGLVGVTFLYALLLIWFFRIIKGLKQARDNFGLFLGAGIFCYFFSQTAINIGMNLGLLPITGIPLPLISYGGSSLISVLVGVGILQSVVSRSQPVRFS